MKVATAIASVALLAQHVSAHGYLSQPAAVFNNGINTAYVKLVTEAADPAFQGKKWNDNPEANTKMFKDAFAKSSFKTLKQMLDKEVPDCGWTSATGPAVDVSKLKSMKWQNDQEGKGFVTSHHGPCEVWIDDVKIMHSDDCVKDYPTYPAEIPVDYSACKGKCQFTFYWLALHEANWQIYKNCALIQNGSGSGGASAPAPTSKAPTTKAPTTPSKTPATTAPSSGGEYDDEYATPKPAATKAPTPAATKAPTPAATKKCKAKRRLSENLRSEN